MANGMLLTQFQVKYFHSLLSVIHFWQPRTSLAHHTTASENVANVASIMLFLLWCNENSRKCWG